MCAEMSYLRGACGVTRWEGQSNESMYEKCGIGTCGSGVKVLSGGMGEKKYIEVVWPQMLLKY